MWMGDAKVPRCQVNNVTETEDWRALLFFKDGDVSQIDPWKC